MTMISCKASWATRLVRGVASLLCSGRCRSC
jgi:hypothetical protein